MPNVMNKKERNVWGDVGMEVELNEVKIWITNTTKISLIIYFLHIPRLIEIVFFFKFFWISSRLAEGDRVGRQVTSKFIEDRLLR